MKAAVMHGAKDIRTETVPDPVCEPHGVIIQVKACGVCGSDLHIYKRDDQAGTIFGHEFSGDIVEVGSQVQGIKEGMRVTAAGFRSCGVCFWCQQGKMHRCSDMALLGYQFPGAMAQFVHVPFAALGRSIFPLPEELTYEDGALVEPLSISYFSVNRAQPKESETSCHRTGCDWPLRNPGAQSYGCGKNSGKWTQTIAFGNRKDLRRRCDY